MKAEEDRFHFLFIDFLLVEEPVKHGDVSAQMEDILFQQSEGLFCFLYRFASCFQLVSIEEDLGISNIDFCSSQRV